MRRREYDNKVKNIIILTFLVAISLFSTSCGDYMSVMQGAVVSFDTDGGSIITDQNIIAYIIEPEAPTKDGYIFDGWYCDDTFTTEWDFSKDISYENITLYAKWLNNSYSITFDSFGGSPVDNQMVSSGNYIIKPTDPTKDGYVFMGWWKDANYTIKWDFENDVVTKDEYLTASWNLEQYSVSFNSNGGSYVDDVQQYPNFTIEKPTDPTKDGFIFEGWYTDNTYSTEWNFSNVIQSDMTLYAKWGD